MPTLMVNGADLYYETFGAPQPGQVPVVLIHGSTADHSEWGLVGPLLARQYYVIVPDCRGHGRSANPQSSYSFYEMAADTAALVRGLGFERAHIIGHSNGGNVALVTLLEYPQVVQTAVIQAANAFVSRDLVEKEPAIFDPERVERENPAWRERMIRLHGPTHGPGYWRTLLRITVQEIITQPNYAPDDLEKVQRPTLVIQGEQDQVNAPARHGQFIARHIPGAELWLVPGVGHTVHDEQLFAWVERLLDFLQRRGEDLNDALYRQKQAYSSREVIFDVRAEREENAALPYPDRQVSLRGRVLGEPQRQAALEVVKHLGRNVQDELRVLLAEDTPWALVTRGVTDLRREPRNLGERVSQALMGEAVRILERGDEWAFVRLESDGYLGWIQNAALHECPAEAAAAYGRDCNAKVVTPLLDGRPAEHCGQAHNQRLPGEHWPERNPKPDGDGQTLDGKLPFGVRVVVEEWGTWLASGVARVRLPDGRHWCVAADGLLALENIPKPTPDSIAAALALVEHFVGVPYLWGGRTPFGFDCSGLAQCFLGFLGVQVRRDADMQLQDGQMVEGKPQPGDLLFFGEYTEDSLAGGRAGQRFHSVSHVAISLGGLEFIHANGATWSTAYNSLDSESPRYREWLAEHLVGVRRYV